jgi:hypothetical protein
MALKMRDVERYTKVCLPWLERVAGFYRRAKKRKLDIVGFAVSRAYLLDILRNTNGGHAPPLERFHYVSYCGLPVYESGVAQGTEILVITRGM